MATRFDSLAQSARRTGVIGGIWRLLVGTVERKRTLASLNDLDDRMLRDIGLTRADVESLRHRD